jgi:hypothetical protein
VGQRAHGLRRQDTGLDGGLQGRLDGPEAVAQTDLAPALPAEHGGAVEEDDALVLGLGAGLQPSSAT